MFVNSYKLGLVPTRKFDNIIIVIVTIVIIPELDKHSYNIM